MTSTKPSPKRASLTSLSSSSLNIAAPSPFAAAMSPIKDRKQTREKKKGRKAIWPASNQETTRLRSENDTGKGKPVDRSKRKLGE
jgi:hypothetical protein